MLIEYILLTKANVNRRHGSKPESHYGQWCEWGVRRFRTSDPLRLQYLIGDVAQDHCRRYSSTMFLYSELCDRQMKMIHTKGRGGTDKLSGAISIAREGRDSDG